MAGVPGIDLGLALDGEDHLVLIVDQVGPQGLGSDLRRAPFNNENHGHMVVGSREARSPELVENAGHIELAVVANVRFVASQGENQIHKGADNAWL